MKQIRRSLCLLMFLFLCMSSLGDVQAVLAANGTSSDGLTITAGRLKMTLDNTGTITGLIDDETGVDYTLNNNKRPMATLYMDGQYTEPTVMTYADHVYTLAYSNNVSVDIRASLQETYLTLEVVAIENPSNTDIEFLYWGPLTTNFSSYGDALGVAYNDDFAVGMFGVNVKTIGGQAERLPQIVAKDSSRPVRFGNIDYTPAVPISGGVMLVAYTEDATIERIRPFKGYSKYTLRTLDPAGYGTDGQIIGSKVAIYGCAKDDIISVVEEFVLAEDLPYMTHNGKWVRDPENYTNVIKADYIMKVIQNDNIDENIDVTRRLGGELIYAHDTFQDYNGDYRFKTFDTYEAFNTNISEVAAQKDIKVGTKNRTNFVRSYAPDMQGINNVKAYQIIRRETTLQQGISLHESYIYLDDMTDVMPSSNRFKAQFLRINDELIKVERYSNSKLKIVQRGAQGTVASSHDTGDTVYIVESNDTSYARSVFFANLNYIKERMPALMVDSVNIAGLALTDFDGWEGAEWTGGHGAYARDVVLDKWYRGLHNVDGVKAYGSGMDQYGWLVFTNQTWGEKYMDVTQEDEFNYRFSRNYDYFARNFYPTSAGLVGITANHSIEDIHWIGSKVAAYNTGIVFADEGISSKPYFHEALDIIREWTIARDVNAFTMDQRYYMSKYNTHWKLEVIEPNIEWNLIEIEDSNGTWTEKKREVVTAPGITNHASLDTTNITSSTSMVFESELNNKYVDTDTYCEVGAGQQYIQLDLGTSQDVDQIRLWHYYKDGRKYKDVVIQLSNDASFNTGVTTVYNNDTDNSLSLGSGSDNEYAETFAGKNLEFDTVNARYVRLWSAGNSVNDNNHYAEVQVISGKRTYGGYYDKQHIPSGEPVNLAIHKTITASGMPENQLSRGTDGNVNTHNWTGIVETGPQWFQVDLASSYDISRMKIWRYHDGGRIYHDCVIQVSNDPNFITGVTTVYNNDEDNSTGLGAGSDTEYPESGTGHEINFTPINGRYVRLYSNGNSVNTSNHLVEIEVYK